MPAPARLVLLLAVFAVPAAGPAAAAVTSWPGSRSTARSTRSRTHHAPAGPSAVAAIRDRDVCGSRRNRPGRSE